jgi:hypothetical protein
VSADSDEGTAEGLLARGAEEISDMPVMAIDVTTVADIPAPPALTIRAVTEVGEIKEYVETYAGPLSTNPPFPGSTTQPSRPQSTLPVMSDSPTRRPLNNQRASRFADRSEEPLDASARRRP